LVVRRQIQSLGQIVDPFRLWALLKSRGEIVITGLLVWKIGELIRESQRHRM